MLIELLPREEGVSQQLEFIHKALIIDSCCEVSSWTVSKEREMHLCHDCKEVNLPLPSSTPPLSSSGRKESRGYNTPNKIGVIRWTSRQYFAPVYWEERSREGVAARRRQGRVSNNKLIRICNTTVNSVARSFCPFLRLNSQFWTMRHLLVLISTSPSGGKCQNPKYIE